MKTSHILKRMPGLKKLFKWHLAYLQRRQRRNFALSHYRPKLESIEQWVKDSNETTNFTYDLHRDNIDYLASFLSIVTSIDLPTLNRYIHEILTDRALRNHVSHMTILADEPTKATADAEVRLSRRIGWYAVVRAVRPKIVIETGVDKGLGACVVCAALMANNREGFPGKYYGTDINPNAGWLLAGEYLNYGQILYGDSVASLRSFSDQIDVFINDSNHSSDYERREYEAIATKLSKNAIILGDNSHCNRELYDFSIRMNRKFLFWQEKPINHWYPGGGIGFSF